jgi:hypothetical protein
LEEAENSTFWKPGCINALNAELSPICHLLALLGAHHILHVSRIKVKKTLPEKVPIFKRTKFSLWDLKEQTSRHRRQQREHLPRDGSTRANMVQKIFTSLQ